MKTKIIYISGNETFEMADIRAAFNEVRETLGLDNNTVLFGVPVDTDSAFEEKKVTESVQETITPQEIEETLEETVKPKKKNSLQSKQQEKDNSDKIIPILSILSANQTQEEEPESLESSNPNKAEITVKEIASETSEETLEAEQIEEITEEEEKVSIDEIMTTDAPVDETEKTLEELLESMAPLREDLIEEDFNQQKEEEPALSDTDSEETVSSDATLEQLANEFAETEDKIVVKPKTETHGKIGKLKNILPFKKAKKDDTGLMGDLFGWAGIAANDEDISIPGFFSTGTQKK